MERNLESIIEEIAQNEELSKEFTAMDEIDEIYAYCKEMGLNSSEEEFDEEVSSMIDNFDLNYSKIGDFELENVAGGSMLDKKFNKVVASALSALTIAGAGAANSNFASAANATSASTVSASASEKTQSAKNIKSSLLRFCKKHKIAVGVTTAAIILAAVYGSVALYKKDANPLHWFITKEDAMREVSVWLITGNLDNVPVGAIKWINDHKKGDPALEELSRRVDEKVQQLEKERS